MISLLKMAPKNSAEVLSSISKHKKAVKCLIEKLYMLGKLHLGMNYSAVGCEFSFNESIIYIK